MKYITNLHWILDSGSSIEICKINWNREDKADDHGNLFVAIMDN